MNGIILRTMSKILSKKLLINYNQYNYNYKEKKENYKEKI